MTQFIRKQIEEDMDIINICEQYNLKEFEPERFLKIRILGKGSFGEVWMCYDLLEDERVAVKFIKIKAIEDQEERIANISSFIREKEILDTVSQKAVDSISKFFGAFYLLDKEGEVESLILVSESGDYNLNELLKARKADKGILGYNSNEVVEFVAQISEGFKTLQELKIYHSDTKLANLVFSKTKNKFIIIDFGVSKLVQSKGQDLVRADEYAGAGTNEFFSPEKQLYWKWCENQDEDSTDTYPDLFNPFKCDMWSLGLIIEKMMEVEDTDIEAKKNSKNKLLNNILDKLKEKDWKKRYDAQELYNFIKKNEKAISSKKSMIFQNEAKLIRKLNEVKYQKRKGIENEERARLKEIGKEKKDNNIYRNMLKII